MEIKASHEGRYNTDVITIYDKFDRGKFFFGIQYPNLECRKLNN